MNDAYTDETNGSFGEDELQTGNSTASEIEFSQGQVFDVGDAVVSPQNIDYLVSKFPFVQVVAGGGVEQTDTVKVMVAESSNWPIYHYGDAMCTSPGPYMLGGGNFRVRLSDDDDEGGSDMVNPGKGTIVNQAFLTCQDMVQIALSEGWESIHVVDGARIMGRGLWIYGESQGLIVTGFEPDEHDVRVQYLVLSSMDDLRSRYQSFGVGPQAG